MIPYNPLGGWDMQRSIHSFVCKLLLKWFMSCSTKVTVSAGRGSCLFEWILGLLLPQYH